MWNGSQIPIGTSIKEIFEKSSFLMAIFYLNGPTNLTWWWSCPILIFQYKTHIVCFPIILEFKNNNFFDLLFAFFQNWFFGNPLSKKSSQQSNISVNSPFFRHFLFFHYFLNAFTKTVSQVSSQNSHLQTLSFQWKLAFSSIYLIFDIFCKLEKHFQGFFWKNSLNFLLSAKIEEKYFLNM